MQLQHYQAYTRYTQEFKEFRHDYKNMLSTINTLLRKNDYKAAIKLLDEMGTHMSTSVSGQVTYSNDLILDAVFHSFSAACEGASIDFDCQLFWNKIIELDDLSTVRIFSNLLKNAFEASEKVPKQMRYIKIRSQSRDNWLDVRIENRFDGVVDEHLETTKTFEKSSHGLGTKIVRKTLEDLGGVFSWKKTADTFTVMLSFPVQGDLKDDDSQ